MLFSAPGGPLTFESACVRRALYRRASRRFAAAVKLYKLKDAQECASALRSTETWRALALAALDVLDIDMAVQAYRQVRAGARRGTQHTKHCTYLGSRRSCAIQAAECLPHSWAGVPVPPNSPLRSAFI